MFGGIPYEYFKQTGFKNGLAIGTFEGVDIKPALLYRILFSLYKAKRFFMNSSLMSKKIKHHAKTIH